MTPPRKLILLIATMLRVTIKSGGGPSDSAECSDNEYVACHLDLGCQGVDGYWNRLNVLIMNVLLVTSIWGVRGWLAIEIE